MIHKLGNKYRKRSGHTNGYTFVLAASPHDPDYLGLVLADATPPLTVGSTWAGWRRVRDRNYLSWTDFYFIAGTAPELFEPIGSEEEDLPE